MAYIAGSDRTQLVLLPEVLDDYVSADNPVRFLDAFVAQLDLGALGFQRSVPADTGRPGYDPGDLLRLYLYGYLHRIRSSRRLEQETHRNVELMWSLRGLRPDFKTIADFRRDHPQALKGVCREFILLCKRLDLFGGELLAIDGSKFRAVNARDRSYTAVRLAKLQRDIERTIARYLRDLERQDEAEAGTEGPSAEALREKIAALEQRRALRPCCTRNKDGRKIRSCVADRAPARRSVTLSFHTASFLLGGRTRHARWRRRPLGSGTASPSLRAVLIHRSIASWTLATASAGEDP